LSAGSSGEIEVALCFCDLSGVYARYAGTLVTSLFSHTRHKVRVTVLHDTTLTEDNRRRFERTAERWGQKIQFIDVSEPVMRLAKNPDKVSSNITRGTIFRLMIPELLDVPKAIYLDSDIIVNMDIAELWDAPVEARGVSLAAVRDAYTFHVWGRGPEKARSGLSGPLPRPLPESVRLAPGERLHRRMRARILRYKPEDYFNSGVLVMNLLRIRETHPSLTAEVFDFMERYVPWAELADEAFLNARFQGDVLYLDERFNLMWDCYNIDDAILHMLSKPWKTPRISPRDELFWKTFIESEWGDTLMDTLIRIYQGKPLASYHSIDCLKLVASRLPRHLRLHLLQDCFIALREWRRRRRE
jgi:lipopolysaccharide biosynthesis glycosyltransferase